MRARRLGIVGFFVLVLLGGCADVLGFKNFTESSGADGGPSPDGGPPSTQEGGSPSGFDAGRDSGIGIGGNEGGVLTCAEGCGVGQTCQEGFCVCDPATCAGCCSGTSCNTAWPFCGASGGACTQCGSTTDRCNAAGACACGTGGPCAATQECVTGACVCNAASCSNGTCCGTTCTDLTSNPTNCGACGRSCQNAACAGSECVPVEIATVGTSATALALSPTNVIWLSPGGIYSCPVAGCGSTPGGPWDTASYQFDRDDLVTYTSSPEPLILASGEELSDTTTSQVSFLEPDGGPTTYVSMNVPEGSWFYDQDEGVYSIDGTSLDLRGIKAGGVKVVMTGLSATAQYVFSDAVNVYVSDGNMIASCPKGTSCLSSWTTFVSAGSPGLMATDPSTGDLFFAGEDVIYRCPATGCNDPSNPPVWVSISLVTAMVADANNLYWTDFSEGTVKRCALGAVCSAPFTIASNLDKPWGIAVDSGWVYWTLSDGAVAVERSPK